MSEQEQLKSIHEQVLRRKRGCFARARWLLLGIWAVALVLIFFVKGGAQNEPADVVARASQLMDLRLPGRFKPYRVNRLFGVEVIAFWDQNHTADNRSLAIVAIQRDDDWNQWTVDQLRDETLANLEAQLNELEFRTRLSQRESCTVEGETIWVDRFSGVQKMDDGLKEATCCYRFIMTPEGPARVQAIGLDEAFPAADQIQVLANIRPLGFGSN